jgi:hypothetical protein
LPIRIEFQGAVHGKADNCHENVNNTQRAQKMRLKYRGLFEKKSTFEAK